MNHLKKGEVKYVNPNTLHIKMNNKLTVLQPWNVNVSVADLDTEATTT